MQICTLTLWAIDRLIAMSLLCGIEFDSSLGLSDKELPFAYRFQDRYDNPRIGQVSKSYFHF